MLLHPKLTDHHEILEGVDITTFCGWPL